MRDPGVNAGSLSGSRLECGQGFGDSGAFVCTSGIRVHLRVCSSVFGVFLSSFGGHSGAFGTSAGVRVHLRVHVRVFGYVFGCRRGNAGRRGKNGCVRQNKISRDKTIRGSRDQNAKIVEGKMFVIDEEILLNKNIVTSPSYVRKCYPCIFPHISNTLYPTHYPEQAVAYSSLSQLAQLPYSPYRSSSLPLCGRWRSA